MEPAGPKAAVRARPQGAAVQHAVKPAPPLKAQVPPIPQSGMPALGNLDAQSVISLQAFAGNAAVASLLARPGSTLQRAPAAVAPPAPPAAAGSADQKALLDKLHNDSK